MEKFNSQIHADIIKKLPFSYLSLPLYLDFCAYVMTRNDEPLVVWQDPYYMHEFPAIFLPNNALNWQRASMSMLTAEEVKKIEAEAIDVAIKVPTETEFFYKTKEFTNPKAKLKERIMQFEKLYPYTIKETYNKDKLRKFYAFWEDQKEHKSNLFEQESTALFFYCLDHLQTYDVRQVYVEIDHKLAGFAWGVEHSGRRWVGIHLKADYAYKGLSRFLHYLRAQLFHDYTAFSLGTGCNEPGLIQYKHELDPFEERQYFYVFTRDKKIGKKAIDNTV